MDRPFVSTDLLHHEILRFVHELDEVTGIHSILDRVLAEARRLTNADAGSIFLMEEARLRFSYVQNDSLFHRDQVPPKALYSDLTLPVDHRSIVGYVAANGKPLNIEDAYDLPAGVPFRFMAEVDAQSGYRTRSVLTAPLMSANKRVIGVIQLINSQDEAGAEVPFSHQHLDILPLFTQYAAAGIERGLLTQELVLRMIKMAELRDPTETGSHVQRVGAMAAEIYHQWALDHGVPRAEWQRFKDLLRLAAMLHDVGKVGISDTILKKPGRLTTEEFHAIKWHSVLGARLFVNISSDLDEMAQEVALNHHEWWDGGGYPGMIPALEADYGIPAEGKRGAEIPLSARITTVADVFDALISRRVYKEPWEWTRATQFIRDGAGSQFDPAVVEAFFAVEEQCRAIHDKFPDLEPALQPSLEARIEGSDSYLP